MLAQVERAAALLARPSTLLGEPITYPILGGLSEFLYGQLHGVDPFVAPLAPPYLPAYAFDPFTGRNNIAFTAPQYPP